MKLDDAIKDFELDCKARIVSSVIHYRNQLKFIQRYLEEEYQIMDVENVRQNHLKLFLSMMTDNGKEPNYINDLLKISIVDKSFLLRESNLRFASLLGFKADSKANLKSNGSQMIRIL